jgi:hypothetical protein
VQAITKQLLGANPKMALQSVTRPESGKRNFKKKSSKLAKDKTNRTRKSQCQKDALWDLYKTYKGHTPPREVISKLSNELNLSE